MFTITRLNSESEVRGLIKSLNETNSLVALDIETTGLDPRQDHLLTIALAFGENAYLFDGGWGKLLESLKTPMVLHNYKFDYSFLFAKGVNILHHECRDTMLLHHLYDENLPHDLDSIVKSFFRSNYKEVFWSKYDSFDKAPLEEQDEYAGKDVLYTLRLYEHLMVELPGRLELIQQVHDLSFHLLMTEITGIYVDTQTIAEKGLDCQVKLYELHKQMRELVKDEIKEIEYHLYLVELSKRKTDKGKKGVPPARFNFGSTQHLQMLLYDKCGIPVQYSSNRKPTVDAGALAKIEEFHPVVKLLLDYRGEQKVFSAFLEAALDKVRNGKIHPSFNINGTVTGRISSSNPNMQQLPAEGGIRGIYIPAPGFNFISADYKQLEVTLAAHFSLDPNLLRVVNEGVSLHDITAEGLGIDRKIAKTVNFAIQYGAGSKKIQKILKCDEAEADQALRKYWATYPGLKSLIDKCHACVDEGTPIENPFGRQRHLYAENPRDKWGVEKVKRQAFNSLIQGTGADITNTAFVRISEELIRTGQGRGLFVVHDEILIEVKKENALYWNSRLEAVMSQVGKDINLRVPLTAEGSGPTLKWED